MHPATVQTKTAQHQVSVLLGGQTVDASLARHNSERLQAELRHAKQRFGNALCLCQDKPLQLVIRERNDKLFLACWPDQSALHALDCPFYSPGEDESAKQRYAPGAIQTEGPNVNLRLHRPLTLVQGSDPADDAPKNTGVHVWGMLHHLWESSALNRWNTSWVRDWGRVQWLLLRAAQSTTLDSGTPLLPSLYVPPVWSDKRRDDINNRWKAFKARLLPAASADTHTECGFIVGVVRSMSPTPHGYAISLRHHSERLFVAQSVARHISGYSRRGWAAVMHLEQDRGTQPQVIAALRVLVTPSGNVVIVEGALMRVSKDFIPCSSSYEQDVAEWLVEQQRSFVKPLHYDHHRGNLPHFILTDCADGNPAQDRPHRYSLYVYGTGIEKDQLRRLKAADQIEATARGNGLWIWSASETDSPPPLPAAWKRPQTSPLPSPQ